MRDKQHAPTLQPCVWAIVLKPNYTVELQHAETHFAGLCRLLTWHACRHLGVGHSNPVIHFILPNSSTQTYHSKRWLKIFTQQLCMYISPSQINSVWVPANLERPRALLTSTGSRRLLPRCWLKERHQASVYPFMLGTYFFTVSSFSLSQTPSSLWIYGKQATERSSLVTANTPLAWASEAAGRHYCAA